MKETYPEILYKYFPVKRIKDVLENRKVAFPNITLLNDPFEFSPSLNIHQSKIVNSNLQKIKLPNILPFYLVNNILDALTGVDRLKFEYFVDKDLVNKNEEFLTFLKKRIGILSLTSTPFSPPMWAHYSDNHEGICVGFEAKALLLEANYSSNYFHNIDLAHLYSVNYENERPILNIDNQVNINNQIFKALTTKSKEWSYEKEYRCFRFLNGIDNRELIELNPKAIKKIFLGINCDVDSLKVILDNEYQHSQIYRLQVNSNKFEFDFTELRGKMQKPMPVSFLKL